MTVAVERIAKELTISPRELERRSLEAFIERKRRLTNLDIADLQDRYGVRRARDLTQRIERPKLFAVIQRGKR